MSCDEFHYRHSHKKVIHRHVHTNDLHHRHTHSDELNSHKHSPSASPGMPDHFHEHTHEAAKHQHSSEHDLLHQCHESEIDPLLEEENSASQKEHSKYDHEPIPIEEK